MASDVGGDVFRSGFDSIGDMLRTRTPSPSRTPVLDDTPARRGIDLEAGFAMLAGRARGRVQRLLPDGVVRRSAGHAALMRKDRAIIVASAGKLPDAKRTRLEIGFAALGAAWNASSAGRVRCFLGLRNRPIERAEGGRTLSKRRRKKEEATEKQHQAMDRREE